MDLDALLRPRSIALYGASERSWIGGGLIRSLRNLGYEGRVFPINPKYEEVLGHTCYASLRDLPEAPDLVAFCVSSVRVLDGFELLPEVGAKAAVIFDAGFSESGEEGRARQQRINAICREAGIALCGPNCMGNLSPHDKATSYILPASENMEPVKGNVGMISQSGSIGIGMLADVRRFGYSYMISSGNEAVLTAADYLHFLVDDPKTKVICTFTESVNDPDNFVAALDRASDAGKPVIVLKVGKSERTRRAITSHTGGLSGETRVFSEVLRRHRAIEVDDMDELTEVLAVCQGERWPAGRNLAVITASGGQAELVLDLATSVDIRLPPLSAADRAEIEEVVGKLTGDGNPTDAWGNGDFATNLPAALKVLGKSKDIDAVAFCSDVNDGQPMGDPAMMTGYTEALIASSRASGKPHYEMNMRPGLMHSHHLGLLREGGIPVIGGVRQGLRAVDRLARWNTADIRPREVPAPAGDGLAEALGGGLRATLHEHDAKTLLAGRGISVTRESLVQDLDAAKAAAGEIGYPVVLKVVSDDLPHKTELGLVHVGIGGESELEQAWQAMAQRAAAVPDGARIAGYLVQEMVAGGIEVFAGVSRDPDFGLSMAFGLGGIAIEVMRDFSLRMLPLCEDDAEAMIAEIRGAALLGPMRGRPAADVESLAQCLYALGDLAASAGDLLREIDLNPIKVMPRGEGYKVVDALIVPEGAGAGQSPGKAA